MESECPYCGTVMVEHEVGLQKIIICPDCEYRGD